MKRLGAALGGILGQAGGLLFPNSLNEREDWLIEYERRMQELEQQAKDLEQMREDLKEMKKQMDEMCRTSGIFCKDEPERPEETGCPN